MRGALEIGVVVMIGLWPFSLRAGERSRTKYELKRTDELSRAKEMTMKLWRWLIVGALASGLAVGCGGDSGSETETNQNQGQGGDGDKDKDKDERDIYNETIKGMVDVWVGAEVGNEENPTPLEAGKSFGGNFNAEGYHEFAVNLEGGSVFEISSLFVGEDLMGDSEDLLVVLEDEETGMRAFFPILGEKREFFVPGTREYSLWIRAKGGADTGFAFETATKELEVEGADFPGESQGDAGDGVVRGHSESFDDELLLLAEVFASRPPVESGLNSVLFVWDADGEELVGFNDDISEELTDSAVTLKAKAETDYVFVVDSFINTPADLGAYELRVQEVASSADYPIALEIGGSYEGTIIEREGDYYRDYFSLNLEAGQYVKVLVEADDELEPYFSVADNKSDMGRGVRANVLTSDDDQAGALLGVAADAGRGAEFVLSLTDQRNVTIEGASFGGDAYGYTITVEAVTPDVKTYALDSEEAVSFDEAGDVVLFELEVDDEVLVWFEADHEVDQADEDTPVTELGLIPAFGMAEKTTVESAHDLMGFYLGAGDKGQFLFRDLFFRAGPEFSTTMKLRSFDLSAQDFSNELALADDTSTLESPSELSLPVKLVGEYTKESPEEEEDFEENFFKISLNAGETLVATTKNAPDMMSDLLLIDGEKKVVAGDRLYMKQYQAQEGDEEPYYDTALVFEAEEDAEYTLVVRPYCEELFIWMFCDVGETEVSIYIEP